MNEALEAINKIMEVYGNTNSLEGTYNYFLTIKKALLKAQEDEKKVEALKELFANHIEFVVGKDRCYFKIKNSKGKEKSFTSYSMLDFWKGALE